MGVGRIARNKEIGNSIPFASYGSSRSRTHGVICICSLLQLHGCLSWLMTFLCIIRPEVKSMSIVLDNECIYGTDLHSDGAACTLAQP